MEADGVPVFIHPYYRKPCVITHYEKKSMGCKMCELLNEAE